MKSIVLVSLFANFLCASSRSVDIERADSDLVVDTTSGMVRGGIGGFTTGKNKIVYWFRSIPYAESPVGNLRFEHPIPKKEWKGILDVSDDSPECIQRSLDNITTGVEDCLYLKIYTTKLPREQQQKLPVIVFIHGGAFVFGSPNFTDSSPDYLLDEDVIVVAPQYRLGMFGFLTTGDLVVPGNNALKDLVLALKWIKGNIEVFGGDSNRITVQGQSAGSVMTSYLLQTNQTTGLFHGAIMQSGVSLCLWAYFRHGLEFTMNIAKDLRLNTHDSQSLVDQLKSIDSDALLNSQLSVLTKMVTKDNPRNGVLLGPVVEPEHEGAIFSGKSYEELQQGQFHNIPILIGHTSLEAYLNDIPSIVRFYLGSFDILLSKLVPIDMHVANLLERHSIGGIIKYKYFGKKLIALAGREVMEFVSDDQFERPIQEGVRLYSARSPVYYYKFSYEGSLFGVVNRTVEGVGHSEDLGYIFDFKYEGTTDDYLMRKMMVKLWTNFVKTGNPTPEEDPLLQNIIWPSNNGLSNIRCLNIDKKLEVIRNVDWKGMVFWKYLYNKYGNNFDTY